MIQQKEELSKEDIERYESILRVLKPYLDGTKKFKTHSFKQMKETKQKYEEIENLLMGASGK